MTGALDNEWDTDIQVSETDSKNIFLSSVHLGQNPDVLEKVSANYWTVQESIPLENSWNRCYPSH